MSLATRMNRPRKATTRMHGQQIRYGLNDSD